MLVRALCLLLGGLASLLAGCETTEPVASVPPIYVPTAAIYQPATGVEPARQIAYARAGDVLPRPGEEDFYVPRSEPFAWGPTSLGGISAYTDYTFDSQQIGTPNNSGWHYRYVWRQGLSYP
jgi:hypothetical protein